MTGSHKKLSWTGLVLLLSLTASIQVRGQNPPISFELAQTKQLSRKLVKAPAVDMPALLDKALDLPPEAMKLVLIEALQNNPNISAREELLLSLNHKLHTIEPDPLRQDAIAQAALSVFDDKVRAVRLYAVLIFGHLPPNSAEVRQALKNKLADDDRGVRLMASTTLAHASDSSNQTISKSDRDACRKFIQEMIEDPDPTISAQGLSCSQHFSDSVVLPRIKKILKSGTKQQQLIAVLGLSDRTSKAALKLKRAIIHSSLDEIHDHAIESLAAHPSEEILPDLEAALDNPAHSEFAASSIEEGLFDLNTAQMLQLWQHPEAQLALINYLYFHFHAVPEAEGKQMLREHRAILGKAFSLSDHSESTREIKELAVVLYTEIADQLSLQKIGRLTPENFEQTTQDFGAHIETLSSTTSRPTQSLEACLNKPNVINLFKNRK